MKKRIITFLVYIGLLSNALSAISNVRLWQCRPSEQPNRNCTQAEQNTVKEWFANAKMEALKNLAADLTSRGIAVTTSQLQKEQAVVSELNEEILQRSDRFKDVQQKMEDMERQRQRVTKAIAG